MAGCGYVCPLCEGTGFSEGEECDFCKKQIFQGKNEQAISEQEEWIKKVHEGPCCSHDLEG